MPITRIITANLSFLTITTYVTASLTTHLWLFYMIKHKLPSTSRGTSVLVQDTVFVASQSDAFALATFELFKRKALRHTARAPRIDISIAWNYKPQVRQPPHKRKTVLNRSHLGGGAQIERSPQVSTSIMKVGQHVLSSVCLIWRVQGYHDCLTLCTSSI